MSPQRIQRVRGWKKPKGAVYVNRPSKWHNPFAPKIIPGWSTGARETAMREFTFWVTVPCHAPDRDGTIRQWGNRSDSYLGSKFADRPEILDIIAELAGKDLVCDCPLSQPCHADVLLDIANSATRQDSCIPEGLLLKL